MKERHFRQMTTLGNLATYLEETEFTNPRVLYLKDEILAHNARVKQLYEENRNAKSQPTGLRQVRYISKDRLRQDQMIPLSRSGRRLVRLYPELQLALKVPHKNASVTEIADSAERMADALTPYLKMLIKAKFPRNCLEVLRKDAQVLRAHADAVQESRALLGRSNRELTEELSLAREVIDELDAVLRTLDDYKSFARNWNFVKRVGARRGRPSKRRLAARERSAARARARDRS